MQEVYKTWRISKSGHENKSIFPESKSSESQGKGPLEQIIVYFYAFEVSENLT